VRVLYDSDPASRAGAQADVRVKLCGPLPEPPGPFPGPGFEEGEERRGRRPPAGFGRFGILPEGADGLWELAVRHRAGSVNAFVSGLRWRNLAVSFGVLLLLAAAMALLVASAQRAQRLAKLQMDFVAGVSHEFRTPLSVISSAGDNLADGVVDANPRVQQYGKLVRDQAVRLRGMVEQILSFAAGAGSRKYDVRPVDPRAAVESALSDCRSLIGEHGFEVEQRIDPGLPRVLADEVALKQCLQNLVSNALKYGGEGRWIGVFAQSRAGEVQITVEDKGPGIERSELAHIFEPFYRGRAARSAQIHGTGLGLSLAREMMEAMGGRISARSSPGKGSAFTLHLKAHNGAG
jgi:signal transduction histidine kinase